MRFKTTDTLTIAGMKGRGKSTYARMVGHACPNIVVYDPLFEYGRIGVVTSNVADIGKQDKTVFQPPQGNDTDALFEAVCAKVWTMKDLVFIVDEVDMHEPLFKITPNYARVLKLGRHKGIGHVAVTRRPQNMNTTIPGLSDHIVCFQLTHPRDLEYMAAFMGRVAYALKDLPKFQYIHYNHDVATLGRTRKFD